MLLYIHFHSSKPIRLGTFCKIQGTSCLDLVSLRQNRKMHLPGTDPKESPLPRSQCVRKAYHQTGIANYSQQSLSCLYKIWSKIATVFKETQRKKTKQMRDWVTKGKGWGEGGGWIKTERKRRERSLNDGRNERKRKSTKDLEPAPERRNKLYQV